LPGSKHTLARREEGVGVGREIKKSKKMKCLGEFEQRGRSSG